jgi:hypothetical protein
MLRLYWEEGEGAKQKEHERKRKMKKGKKKRLHVKGGRRDKIWNKGEVNMMENGKIRGLEVELTYFEATKTLIFPLHLNLGWRRLSDHLKQKGYA